MFRIKLIIYLFIISAYRIYAFNDLDTLYYPSAKEVDPTVTNFVIKVDSFYKYNYTISSSINSQQNIWRILIENKDKSIKGDTPEHWKSSYVNKQNNNLPVWGFRSYSFNSDIHPGETINGFNFLSKGLPSILKYFVEGNTDLPEFDEENEDNSEMILVGATFVENSVKGFTLGPLKPPKPFIYVEFISQLNTYTDSSYSLGWIKDEQTRDKYNNYFSTAKTYLEQGDSSTARAELQKVLTDCNTDSSTVLTSEAYALLYFNTEYLVNKLPKEIFPANDIDAKVKAKVIRN